MNKENYLNNLPDELYIEIMLFLTPEILLKKIILLNKRFKDISLSEYIWKNFVFREFKQYDKSEIFQKFEIDKSWIKLFKKLVLEFKFSDLKDKNVIVSEDGKECSIICTGTYNTGWNTILLKTQFSKGKHFVELLYTVDNKKGHHYSNSGNIVSVGVVSKVCNEKTDSYRVVGFNNNDCHSIGMFYSSSNYNVIYKSCRIIQRNHMTCPFTILDGDRLEIHVDLNEGMFFIKKKEQKGNVINFKVQKNNLPLCFAISLYYNAQRFRIIRGR